MIRYALKKDIPKKSFEIALKALLRSGGTAEQGSDELLLASLGVKPHRRS